MGKYDGLGDPNRPVTYEEVKAMSREQIMAHNREAIDAAVAKGPTPPEQLEQEADDDD